MLGGAVYLLQNNQNNVGSYDTTTTPLEALERAEDTKAMMEQKAKDSMMSGEEQGTPVDPPTASPTSDGEVMQKDAMVAPAPPVPPTPAVQTAGSYETYAPEKLARAETGDVVLFFHAPWCPTCRAADSAIESSRANIPSTLTILKTDYDSNTKLRQTYGITSQHTFVQVDKSGNMIGKWSGGTSLADITRNLK